MKNIEAKYVCYRVAFLLISTWKRKKIQVLLTVKHRLTIFGTWTIFNFMDVAKYLCVGMSSSIALFLVNFWLASPFLRSLIAHTPFGSTSFFCFCNFFESSETYVTTDFCIVPCRRFDTKWEYSVLHGEITRTIS